MKNKKKQICFGIGNEMWVTPCHICGKDVRTWHVRDDLVYKCKECREKEKEDAKLADSEYLRLQKTRRLNTAKKVIAKAYGNCDEYERAIEVIEKKIQTPGWFESTNEVIAALELVRSKVRARHQVKMGRWRTDFVLPDMKVILEIDGGFHKQEERKEKDLLKDKTIIASIGPSWEIVRINDELLRSNPKKLVDAIERIVAGRKKTRKLCGGSLPKNYSKTI